jgi:outer membrane protein OmpA-like peptidoglycan-associated protein
MRLSRALATLLLAFAAGVVAAEKYPDPDGPATQAAARAALGSPKILDIVATTRDIVATTRDIENMTRGIEGKTRGIESALKDLNAKVTGQEIRIELSADVLFDFDKHDLRPEAVPSLEKVAEVLRSRAGSPVTIEGHSDGKGSDAYNQPLSEKRAQAVRAWLVKNGGASAAKITTKGWGKSKPVVSNTRPDGSDDPDGRKKNRRVEITVRTG